MVAPLLLAILARAPTTRSELVSSVVTCAPGKPFVVALHMSLPRGWHNYYSNPGESGMPTTIKWSLPPGFTASPIRWPVPKRVVIDTINNYVYEGDEWLLTTITPPKGLNPGPIAIGAKAEWLLCQVACVSQSATLHLTLNAGSRAIVNRSSETRIAAIQKSLPARPSFPVSAHLAGSSVELRATNTMLDPVDATFFAADPNYFGVDKPVVTYSGGVLSVTFPLSKYANQKPTRLKGILSFPVWSKSFWVDVPIS
jgi:thiol:disulfide interchange protein DsbD